MSVRWSTGLLAIAGVLALLVVCDWSAAQARTLASVVVGGLLLAGIAVRRHEVRQRAAASRLAQQLGEARRETASARRRARLVKRKLVKTRRELEQSERAAEATGAAQDEFLANMNHELRTPMNGIIGMIALALDGPLEESQHSNLGKALGAARDLLRTLSTLVDMASLKEGRLELEEIRFDLRALVEEALELSRPRAIQKGLKMSWSLAPSVPTRVVGDPGRLKQILSHLIDNAVKFTEAGGVTLDVDLPQETHRQLELRFDVRDTGVGFAKDRFDHLLQAFSQGDSTSTRKYAGMGLGLTIADALVTSMSGRLWAESSPGQGSTFSFTVRLGREDGQPRPSLRTLGRSTREVGVGLPPKSLSNRAPTRALDEAMPRLDVGGARERARERLAGCRVLLVEDNELNQHIATELLRQVGVDVDIAGTGHEALETLAEQSYDAVLMDLQMPEMNGYDATRTIRLDPKHHALPVIAMTANVRPVDRERCAAAGMNDHLSKPIDREQLYQALMRWVVRRDAVFPAGPVSARVPTTSESPGLAVQPAPEQSARLAVSNMRGLSPALSWAAAGLGSGSSEANPVSIYELNTPIPPGREPTPSFFGSSKPVRFGSGLPSRMPGIDVAKGVELTGGREVFYLEILDGFMSRSRTVPNDVARQLGSHDVETAQRTIHTLKGLAGAVGAVDLQDTARQLELALREENQDRLAGMLGRLDEQLRPVLASAEALCARLAVPRRPSHRPSCSAAGATPAAVPLLRELYGHLQACSLVDDALVENLGQALRGQVSNDELAEIQTFVHDFEYDAAIAKIQSIASRLEVSL